jgi:ribonuclease HI
MSEKTTIILTADGASKNNQSPSKRKAGFGYLIQHDGETITEEYQYIGQGTECTNNFAEYRAVIVGVQDIKKRFPDRQIDLLIRSDSEVVVKQLNGVYNADKMQEQYELCIEELNSLASWQAEHVSEVSGNNIDRVDTLAAKSFK